MKEAHPAQNCFSCSFYYAYLLHCSCRLAFKKQRNTK